ncbi:MAG TPA: carboxymuconolactone decarboxylase family protein [Actinomycetota bacterium]|nr:carboxymuconolactone decarboxylase family protein [Actinomycetota bacterium]
MVARLEPLEPPYPAEIGRTLERMMGGADVEPLLLFRTIAHNSHLLDKLRSTGSYLLNFGVVDPLEREIVILRTCARCGSEYEWGVHVAIYSSSVGLTPEQVDATVDDRPVWTQRQLLLVRLVDELHDTGAVSDDLWTSLSANWQPAELVELVALVGQYHAISFITNAFSLPSEAFAAPFPGT